MTDDELNLRRDLTSEAIREATPGQVDEWIAKVRDMPILVGGWRDGEPICGRYTEQWSLVGALLEGLQGVDTASLYETRKWMLLGPGVKSDATELVWICGPRFSDGGVSADWGCGDTGPEAIARAWLRAWAEGLLEVVET